MQGLRPRKSPAESTLPVSLEKTKACVVPVRDVPKRANQRTPSGRWVIPTGNRRRRNKHLHITCASYAPEQEADRKCKAESLDWR
jgi:hypothetical protein